MQFLAVYRDNKMVQLVVEQSWSRTSGLWRDPLKDGSYTLSRKRCLGIRGYQVRVSPQTSTCNIKVLRGWQQRCKYCTLIWQEDPLDIAWEVSMYPKSFIAFGIMVCLILYLEPSDSGNLMIVSTKTRRVFRLGQRLQINGRIDVGRYY
jgi:hypothetical protein